RRARARDAPRGLPLDPLHASRKRPVWHRHAGRVGRRHADCRRPDRAGPGGGRSARVDRERSDRVVITHAEHPREPRAGSGAGNRCAGGGARAGRAAKRAALPRQRGGVCNRPRGHARGRRPFRGGARGACGAPDLPPGTADRPSVVGRARMNRLTLPTEALAAVQQFRKFYRDLFDIKQSIEAERWNELSASPSLDSVTLPGGAAARAIFARLYRVIAGQGYGLRGRDRGNAAPVDVGYVMAAVADEVLLHGPAWPDQESWSATLLEDALYG